MALPGSSKLPTTGTTIFTRMSELARQHNAINLSQGFPDFDAPAALLDALCRAVKDGHNQYAPMAGLPALRAQLALQIRRHRSIECDPEHEITIVPGATEGIFCSIMACVHRGDEVIVLDPSYDSYAPAITLAGGRPVHVALRPETFTPDWEAVEAAITSRSRMIVINSPHNPTGTIWPARDMQRLEALAQQYDLLVCSDEVYEHLVYDGAQHNSVLHWPGLRSRAFVHFSFGKTFSVTGWKTGYCVAPPALTAALRSIHQFVAFVAVTPIQQALADFIAAQPDYADNLSREYQRRRDLFCNALEGSRFSLTPSQGTYFQLLDYGAICTRADTEICERWTQELRVASIPVSVFYQRAPKQQLLRFCFAKRDEVLLEAAEILCKI